MKAGMQNLDELRDELSHYAQPEKKGGRSPREERIIAGFEEIQQFVLKNNRVPVASDDNDIFERLYAVRLKRLRELDDCRTLLAPLDHQGLLDGSEKSHDVAPDVLSDDELRAELDGMAAPITELRHVRSRAEIEAAEELAKREKCPDFEKFEPLFDQVQRDLKSGVRTTVRFGKDADITKGDFFILSGQTVYIAEVGKEYKTPNGETNGRMRVIYSNGTESDLLIRSLQRALYKDDGGRRISNPSFGNLPIFGDSKEADDEESGTIYVLRSQSNHPYVSEHRQFIHKIGVTGGKVETRIANAEKESTYLLAKVDVIATYKLVDINRVKLENLLHRIFAPGQINITIHDRFGNPVQPKEWFLVPLAVINEVVERIRDGSITKMIYDPKSARLVQR